MWNWQTLVSRGGLRSSLIIKRPKGNCPSSGWLRSQSIFDGLRRPAMSGCSVRITYPFSVHGVPASLRVNFICRCLYVGDNDVRHQAVSGRQEQWRHRSYWERRKATVSQKLSTSLVSRDDRLLVIWAVKTTQWQWPEEKAEVSALVL